MARKNILALCALVLVTYISTARSVTTIHDILRLLSIKEEIETIEHDHLKNDEGFRSAVNLLKGNQWRDLLDSVVKKPECLKFAEMAKMYDMDIAQAISWIRNHIDSLEVTGNPAAEPNLESFITEVKIVLPVNQIVHTLVDVLDTAEGKKLLTEISSMQNKKLADDVYNLPEMGKMREILKGMKFDVEPYIAFVYEFLEWDH